MVESGAPSHIFGELFGLNVFRRPPGMAARIPVWSRSTKLFGIRSSNLKSPHGCGSLSTSSRSRPGIVEDLELSLCRLGALFHGKNSQSTVRPNGAARSSQRVDNAGLNFRSPLQLASTFRWMSGPSNPGPTFRLKFESMPGVFADVSDARERKMVSLESELFAS
jgi:hypothetical protein